MSAVLSRTGRRNQFSFLSLPRFWEMAALILLLLLGFGLRMLNLTDPPLGFHPTRQLRSAIIARGMYYQSLPSADPQARDAAMQIWATMERYEPPILERLVALTYRVLGGEHLWVARIYSSLFWVLGGLALYGLVRRSLSAPSSLFALSFYLLLPWGVLASRSFQPDPWMVMLILFSAYALQRWAEKDFASWRWAVLAGLCSGLAVLIKAYAAFPVGGMALFVGLSFLWEPGGPLKQLFTLLRRRQIWLYALITAIIPGIYYFGLGDRSTSFASFWIFSFTGLLADRKFYIHWLGLIRGIMDGMIFFAALLGGFLYPRRMSSLVLGFWLGYFLIGATFPYQIYTHDYYSLALVPLAAISLAPIAEGIFSRLRGQPWLWKAAFTALFLAVLGYYSYVARSQVIADNNKAEPYPWQRMGEDLPGDGSYIALTHDYGNRLKYYGWRSVTRIWPAQGDLDLSAAAAAASGAAPADNSDFAGYFQAQTAGMDYFLVTLFGDLEGQPELKSMLYDHYPIYQQGDGYVLFDLRHPKP